MLVRKTYLIITIVWLVILTILSFLDFSNQDILAPKNSDKVVHFLLYFTLTIVAVKSVKSLPYKYFIIPFSCFLYGTLIEIFQELFTNTRKADFFDIMANTFGIIIAIVLDKYFNKNI